MGMSTERAKLKNVPLDGFLPALLQICSAEEETPSRSMHLGRVSQLNDILAKLLRHQQIHSSSTEIATKSRQTKVSRDSSSSKQFSLFSHSTHHPRCQQG